MLKNQKIPTNKNSKSQKKCFPLSFTILGRIELTRALQSSPFQNPGGMPWAWRRTDKGTEILVSNIGWIYFGETVLRRLFGFINKEMPWCWYNKAKVPFYDGFQNYWAYYICLSFFVLFTIRYICFNFVGLNAGGELESHHPQRKYMLFGLYAHQYEGS